MFNDLPVKNHPSVILKNSVVTILALMLVGIASLNTTIIIVVTGLSGLLVIFFIIWWYKTTFTITDCDITVIFDVIFKNKKRIPYEKIASVNLSRGIFDRIFDTTTVRININSAVSATVPEVAISMKKKDAEELRAFIFSRMIGEQTAVRDNHTPFNLMEFAPKDVVIHSIFGATAWQSVASIVLLGYSLISLFFNSAGLIVALVLFFVNMVISLLSGLLMYFNFKVYRHNDRIFVEHGLIRTYKSEFEVSRINAIRIKRPMLARLLHKSCIEAEVVGMGSVSGDARPMLCLLFNDSQIKDVMRELVPEFLYEHKTEIQPKEAKFPLLSWVLISFAIFVVAIILPAVLVLMFNGGSITGILTTTQMIGLSVAVVVFLIIALLCVRQHMKTQSMDTSDDMFTFVNGIVDVETVTMNYDRIQIVNVYSSPMARRFGLARCKVSMMSAVGAATIKSGYFKKNDLMKIPEIIIQRIEDGKYHPPKTF